MLNPEVQGHPPKSSKYEDYNREPLSIHAPNFKFYISAENLKIVSFTNGYGALINYPPSLLSTIVSCVLPLRNNYIILSTYNFSCSIYPPISPRDVGARKYDVRKKMKSYRANRMDH